MLCMLQHAQHGKWASECFSISPADFCQLALESLKQQGLQQSEQELQGAAMLVTAGN